MFIFKMLMSLVISFIVLKVLWFFIARSFFGKSIILTFKLVKSLCKFTYLSIKKSYILINKSIDKLEKQQNKKVSSKMEVESKKVVNLGTYREDKNRQ